jgi:glycine hydroxymethyltransferase
MSIADIGQKVLALPEKAGGHVASYSILKRLGLQVRDIPFDCKEMKVDRAKCIEEIECFQPDFIFVDRSEGLVYEDFTWLGQYQTPFPCYKIFDASQYLTNIICHDYTSPFEMGFDLILSTLHKNLPGPQRALVCAKEANETWSRLRSGISTYVSNMHVFSIYSAGLLLKDYEKLKLLSRNMLDNAYLLEKELLAQNIPVVTRNSSQKSPPTHHCWIGPLSKHDAFNLYTTLEKLGILTNYRLLPYDIGYGLRLGLSGATNSGLRTVHIPELAEIIAKAYINGHSDVLANECANFICKVKGSRIDGR